MFREGWGRRIETTIDIDMAAAAAFMVGWWGSAVSSGRKIEKAG